MKFTSLKFFIKYFSIFGLLIWISSFLVTTLVVLVYFKTHSQIHSEQFVSSFTKTNISFSTDLNNNITDALIIAIHNLVLFFFIHPLAWLINQLTNIIIFLGSGNLLNDLMFHNEGIYNLPKSFWIILVISSALSIIFIIYKLIILMISNYSKQKIIINETFKNVILILLFLPLVPIIFYLINQVLIIVIYYLLYKSSYMNLSLLIFNASFLDHLNNLSKIPTSTSDPIFLDQEHFSYFLCTITYLVMVYIIFNVAKKLVIFTIELLWLFVTTIAVLVSVVAKTDDSYSYLKQHNLMILQHILIFFSIFLAFNIFISSIPIIINSIENANLKLAFSKSILILIVICSYAFFILETPLLISNVIGIRSMINPFRHSKNLFLSIRTGHRRATDTLKSGVNVLRKPINHFSANFKNNDFNDSEYEEKISKNIDSKNDKFLDKDY